MNVAAKLKRVLSKSILTSLAAVRRHALLQRVTQRRTSATDPQVKLSDVERFRGSRPNALHRFLLSETNKPCCIIGCYELLELQRGYLLLFASPEYLLPTNKKYFDSDEQPASPKVPKESKLVLLN